MVCLSYWLYNKFMNNLIVLNKNDNVGVSQFIIPEKTKIEGHEISTIDPIPFGHKVCLKTIKKGDPIIKYDQIIGFALDDIKPGQHVHSHNLEFREFKRDFKVTDKKHVIDEKADTFFNGILRDNGQVATRNYIGIVSTVNCSATVTKMIVERIKYSDILKDYPNIDGIVPITHSTGCGMNTESEGMQIFQRTIDGFKNHPNFSHVFVIGLGCECAQVSLFDESLKVCEDYDLWLRITSKYQVIFLDVPLIYKYGGHADQLSKVNDGIESYRIQSLEKIIKFGFLSDEQKVKAVNALVNKMKIYSKGLEKRKKLDALREIKKNIQFLKKEIEIRK